MFSTLIYALSACVITAQASQICSDRTINDTKVITTPSGTQFSMSRFDCALSSGIQTRNPVNLDSRKLLAKQVTGCTDPDSDCLCGIPCVFIKPCSASPNPIKVADCQTLINSLAATPGSIVIEQDQAFQATFGTCSYFSSNLQDEDSVEYCYSDIANGAQGILNECGGNRGSCAGGAFSDFVDYFVEYGFSSFICGGKVSNQIYSQISNPNPI